MANDTGRESGAGRLGRAVVGGPVLAALGWIGYSALFIPHDLPLPHALSGTRREFSGRGGRLSYYVEGEGEPLLLIHSINAAASAYEVKPVYERFSHRRRVYAPDLPGFGFSDRSPRDYSPRLYTDAIRDMLDEISRDCGPTAVDALALSLSGEFLARAASERPDRFQTLALITPTGFGEHEQRYGPDEAVLGQPWLREALSFPLWSRALFDLLNSRPSQLYFLSKVFGSASAVDPGLLDYDYVTAHQPDAQHAPYAFVSGLLFSADIDRVYESLTIPVWLAYGARGSFTDYGDTGNVAARPNWSIERFETGGMPHFERPADFSEAYDQFMERVAAR